MACQGHAYGTLVWLLGSPSRGSFHKQASKLIWPYLDYGPMKFPQPAGLIMKAAPAWQYELHCVTI